MSLAAARRDAHVIVVGAGPAGAATAILLADCGLDTIVLDRARFPRPKICGDYLSPETARVLDALGVLKAVDAAAVPLRGMRITAPDGTALVGTYRAIASWRPYRQHAMAIPRAILDATLADRLRGVPVDFREDVRVTDLLVERGDVVGVEALDAGGRALTLRAPLVVGADGRASVVAQRLGCRTAHPLARMALVAYAAGIADCREYGEVVVDPPDYAILNPVGEDRVNVSLVVPLAHAARYSDRLETFFTARVRQLPHLARRLAGAHRVEPLRAMGPLAYRVAPPPRAGVLLVGDAAGFYDPFTGEGVYAALRGAELVAETVRGPLRDNAVSLRMTVAYEAARRQAFVAKERVVRLLQAVVGRRWLANRVAHAFTRRPERLDLVMGVIGDFVPARALVSTVLRG